MTAPLHQGFLDGLESAAEWVEEKARVLEHRADFIRDLPDDETEGALARVIEEDYRVRATIDLMNAQCIRQFPCVPTYLPEENDRKVLIALLREAQAMCYHDTTGSSLGDRIGAVLQMEKS